MFSTSRKLAETRLQLSSALSLADSLRAQTRAQEAEIRLLNARILAQKEDIERLLKHNRELANRPIPERSEVPLYISEDEEDIRFMRDTQMISIAEAEDMLRELDFENESIIVYDEPDF